MKGGRTTYNGFKNYSTWALFNYISNHEEAYNKYVAVILIARRAGEKGLYELKNALEDDFKKPGIIDINESESAGLYADILDDALSEIDFLQVARAFLH